MARYIDADKFMVALNDAQIEFSDTYEGLGRAKFLLSLQPTVDVAPKSEVEKQKLEIWRLEGEIERLKRICNSYALQYGTVRDQQKVIDESKAEVAREIFEEIEKDMIPYVDHEVYRCIRTVAFNRIKKEYTEG